MTIASDTSKVIYTGNGSATTFPVTFLFFKSSDLVVVKTVDDADTTLTEGVDYSVSGEGDVSGGEVVYPLSGAALTSNEYLTIKRVVPYVQETDLRNQGGFYPEVVEDQFDRLVMLAQDLNEKVNRSLKVGVSQSVDPSDVLQEVFDARDSAAADAAFADTRATDADNRATDAENRWQDFTSRYYGPLASDPATDAYGNPPTHGDFYFNTDGDYWRVHDGAQWKAASDLITAGTAATKNHGTGTDQIPLNDDLQSGTYVLTNPLNFQGGDVCVYYGSDEASFKRYYGFPNSTYLQIDKPDTPDDASLVFTNQGVTKAEIGLITTNDLHFKTVSGTVGTGGETFTDRLVLKDSGFVDVFNSYLRVNAATGQPTLIVGNSNGVDAGAGFEIIYDQDNTQGRFRVIERGNVFRKFNIESNGFDVWQTEPAARGGGSFLRDQPTWEMGTEGALLTMRQDVRIEDYATGDGYGALSVQRGVTAASVDLAGNATVGGDLNITGSISQATVTNNASVGGSFSVTGLATLSNGLNITGSINQATITNNASVGGTLDVTGNTTLGGTLGAGATTVASLQSNGNAAVGGSFSCNSTTASATFSGPTSVYNTLGVTGVVTLDSDVNMGGGLGVVGAVTIDGGVTCNTTLDVTGKTTTNDVDILDGNVGMQFIPESANSQTRIKSIEPGVSYRRTVLETNTMGIYSGAGTVSKILELDANGVEITGDLDVSGQVTDHQKVNSQGASYTLALSDDGKHVRMEVATANNLTIPANATVAFPIGTTIDVFQGGGGTTTLVPATGVTLNARLGLRNLDGQYAHVRLVKVNTDQWDAYGDLA